MSPFAALCASSYSEDDSSLSSGRLPAAQGAICNASVFVIDSIRAGWHGREATFRTPPLLHAPFDKIKESPKRPASRPSLAISLCRDGCMTFELKRTLIY